MSGDLVVRLRDRAASVRTPGGQLVYADPAMLLAAADEIERLRAQPRLVPAPPEDPELDW